MIHLNLSLGLFFYCRLLPEFQHSDHSVFTSYHNSGLPETHQSSHNIPASPQEVMAGHTARNQSNISTVSSNAAVYQADSLRR